jgi:cytoskeletal protein RodZ
MRAPRWSVVTVLLLVVGAGSLQVAGADELMEPPPAPEPAPATVPPTTVPEPAVEPPAPEADTSAQQGPFANCTQARDAGRVNIRIGDPDYSPDLDDDGDGIACENGDSAPVTTPPTTALLPPTTAPTTTVAPQVAGATQTQVFQNCTEAQAAGQTNIPSSSPAYRSELDRDNDGIACDAGDDSATGASAGSSGSLATTGQSNLHLTVLAGMLVGLGVVAILARKRLSTQRFIVIHSKTGAIRFVPRARRIQ